MRPSGDEPPAKSKKSKPGSKLLIEEKGQVENVPHHCSTHWVVDPAQPVEKTLRKRGLLSAQKG